MVPFLLLAYLKKTPTEGDRKGLAHEVASVGAPVRSAEEVGMFVGVWFFWGDFC